MNVIESRAGRHRAGGSRFDFRGLLKPGDRIAWPQGTGEPLALTGRLIAQADDLPPVNLFVGMTTSRTLTADTAAPFGLTGLNGAGANRRLTSAGLLDVVPCHVSAVPDLLRSRAIRVDVALVRARPHPRAGFLTVGVVADYTRALIDSARCVIAEIDERLPVTGQDALIPAAAVDHFVDADGPELLLPDPEPDEVEIAVAARVAALIPDGATIQLGIGGLPVAVARALFGHRELGFHGGVASDVLVELVERGVVTNSRKRIDRGVSVTGCLFGTRRLIDHADGNCALAMRAVDHTHSLTVMAGMPALHSVNGAVEVDLTGQVNAEQAGDRYLGAVGGQVDFVRGAQRSQGGRSIIALPAATADGSRSRIVASLAGRPVTTARSDVDVVVTEHGVAELRGIGLAERARRLTAIAHPDFRDALERAARAPGAGRAAR